VTYVDELSRELARRGVHGRSRRRSHLANEFAAELGTHASRRAAVAAFAALAIAGAVYAAVFVTLSPQSIQSSTLVTAVVVIAPQVAFVAGVLALARARRRSLATAELTVLHRRTGTALAFGAATMGALAAAAGSTTAYVAAAAATTLLAAAAAPLLASVRIRPQVAGSAGDVFDDLGIERLRTDPWRFARLVALGVGAAVALAGVVQGDPLDGLARGILEGAACLAGFAALGRYLGLRR
jgi:hypothetical protein